MIARSLKRRQGQGMTEYIILVGLIAILLITVVTQFKTSIQVTIEGTTDKTNDIANEMPDGGSVDPGGNPGPGGGPGGYTSDPSNPGYYRSSDPGDTTIYERNPDGSYTPRRP